jgi:hypothetical protein
VGQLNCKSQLFNAKTSVLLVDDLLVPSESEKTRRRGPYRSYRRSLPSVLLLTALIGVPLARAADSPNSNESPTWKPQTPLFAAALLEQARQSASRIHQVMAGFVCSERITRFNGNLGNKQSRKIDVITSRVAYNSDKEQYTDIRQNDKPLSRIGAVKGAWSEGEYGTFLREAGAILNSRPVRFLSISSLDNQPAAAYSFDLAAEESPWDIQVSGKHYTLPFHGQLWISPGTGNILRIDRISSRVPPETGISGVNWSVGFAQIDVEGKSCWLPVKAIYSVTYLNSGRHEWNTIVFSDYHRYGSDVVVHFQ